MAKQKPRPHERDLYPRVSRWLAKRFRCFATATNVGLRYSRIDVLGLRDVGGDLSGDVETISIEVKRGLEPFATASGQALGYKVYANRVYLADYRDKDFGPDELQIASSLGIGLIRIGARSIVEELSSPVHSPIPRLNLRIVEAVGYGRCALCGTLFRTGEDPKRNRFSRLAREDVARAIKAEKGLMFWNRELAERKRRLGLRRSEEDSTFERRYFCPDCVMYVLADLRHGSA
jgi:hypothetical protein